MACIVMACKVMACVAMAYMAMADTVMASFAHRQSTALVWPEAATVAGLPDVDRIHRPADGHAVVVPPAEEERERLGGWADGRGLLRRRDAVPFFIKKKRDDRERRCRAGSAGTGHSVI